MELIIACSVTAALFIGACLSSYYSPHRRLKRELHSAPLTTIERCNENATARLQGELVQLGELLEAPLTGRSCAYFVATVEEQGGKHWRELAREEKWSDFVLEDGTGQALIRMEGAKTVIHRDAQYWSDTHNQVSPEIEAFLTRHGESSKGLIFKRTLRYREGVLEPGEQVMVRGRGVREINPDRRIAPTSGYRNSAAHLVMRSDTQIPLYITDDPDLLER